MRKIVFFLLLISTEFLYSQSIIDSLKNIVAKSEHEKALINHLVGYHHQYPDSNVYYQNKALTILKLNEGDTLFHNVYKQLGIASIQQQKWDVAKAFLDSSGLFISRTSQPTINTAHLYSLHGVIEENTGNLTQADSLYSLGIQTLETVRVNTIRKKQSLANLLTNKGALYQKKGTFDLATQNYFKALALREELGETSQILIILNNIAGIYSTMERYRDAYDQYSKMYELSQREGQEFLLMYGLTGLGAMSFQLGRSQEAIQQLLSSEKLADKFNDLYNKNIIYENLTSIYTKTKEFNLAEQYAKKAIKLSQDISDSYLEAETMNNLGEIQFLQRKYKKAKSTLLTSLQISQSKGYSVSTKDALKILANVYDATKEFEKAYTSYKDYSVLNDSLNSVEKNKAIEEITTKYDVEKKNTTILSQELVIEKTEKENRRIIFLLIIFSLIIVFLGYVLSLRKRALKEERSRLIEEIDRGKRLVNLVNQFKKSSKKIEGIVNGDFLEFVKKKLNINEDLMIVYVELYKGKTYKQIANHIGLQESGAKTRIHKLYEALKMYFNNYDSEMSNSKATKFLNDLFIEYQTNTSKQP